MKEEINKTIKTKTKTSKTKQKDSLTEEEKEEYKSLVDYIIKIYKIKAPDNIMFTQIKKMKTKGITYAQMEYVLFYIVEIKQSFNPIYKLGQIENNFEDAKRYAMEQSQKEERLQETIQKLEPKTVVVKYKPHTSNTTPILIDINTFLEEGGD